MIRKISIVIIIILGLIFAIGYLSKNAQDIRINSKYSNCELGDLVGDDVERIEYKNFYVDYHVKDFTKSQIENFAQSCIKDNVKTQYQMDCCVRMQMYPEK